MILDFLLHLMELDFPWLMNFIAGNILWVFVFIAAVYIFFDGKHTLLVTGLLVIDVWGWMDFTNIMGWVLLTGGLLSVYYISKLAIMGFAAHDENLKKHLALITVLHGVSVIILYNIFMSGA